MPYSIAMVSDFFYPQPGGVESHVYQLSAKLISLGHSVVIITHAYGDRTGVRILTNGLKVYYVPFLVLYRESTFPTVFSFFPIFRQIIIREAVDIVHGHGSLSSLCHEAILHGRTMGLRTVFTDHSLFGFADVGSILGNKLLKFTLSDVGHVICVSHTCKENTVLRASLDPLNVSVIPNAVVAENFRPDPSQASSNRITILVISRLYPNKGADLLTAVIPRICMLHKDVHFIIAGSGPREIDIEQMREKYRLQERVDLIGSIRHEDVRDVMVKGHIYLHPTLTEAFGTVLVEAASCGLLVVTTKVGGIPEVLPPHMTIFSSPSVDSLVESTSEAIRLIKEKRVDTSRFHDEIKGMYSWEDVAERTQRVYDSIDTERLREPLAERMKRYYGCGVWAGKLFVLCVVVDYLLLWFLEWWYPREDIDLVRKWPTKLGQQPLLAGDERFRRQRHHHYHHHHKRRSHQGTRRVSRTNRVLPPKLHWRQRRSSNNNNNNDKDEHIKGRARTISSGSRRSNGSQRLRSGSGVSLLSLSSSTSSGSYSGTESGASTDYSSSNDDDYDDNDDDDDDDDDDNDIMEEVDENGAT